MNWTLFLGMALLVEGVAAVKAMDRPNVIVILADDQGSVDMGCYGSGDLATPHLDALAARGVRFTQFYSAAPVCSPSRAGLLTGRYPLRAGVPGNCSSQKGGKEGLPAAEVTMAEVFKSAGYRTAHLGKWHLGYTVEMMPNQQGFDHSFGHMGGCIDNYSHFFYWSGPNVHDLYRNGVEIQEPGRYFPDLMVEEASAFMADESEKPFFLYFALNLPHYPYQGEPEFLERFKDLPYPRNLYAAFMASLDRRVGMLLEAVNAVGVGDNTVVVYQSDNGHSEEERAHFGGGSAGWFRGEKFSLFEGGIRLPAMISWPAHLPEGAVRDQVGHACDWLPTLAELCGIRVDQAKLDGRSLVSVLRSAEAPSPHEGEFLHWQVGEGAKAQWAVREGPWKVIGNPRGGEVEPTALWLSNLDEDLGERINLAEGHPEVVARLKAEHERWLGTLQ